MTIETYTTSAGELVEFERPPKAIASFLARVIDASNNPNITESAMVDLVYGAENPLLRQGVIPGHGMVTRETLENPIYLVMLDLLVRKRVQVGTIGTDGWDEPSITVTEAAKRLGINQTSVRQAIQAGRLGAVKRGKLYLITPSALAAFKVARRGPAPRRVEPSNTPALRVRIGNAPGGSLRLNVRGGSLRETSRQGHVIDGEVASFDAAALMAGGEGRHRFFELAPSEEENELRFHEFCIRGRFGVVSKENNSTRAHEAWRAWHAQGAQESGSSSIPNREKMVDNLGDKSTDEKLKI